MPEIKNMFQKGVMNKDLDERLVPNGQYRDAMNVQVSTSESSEVGTVQNILGNTRVEDIIGEQFKCVGAVADEKNDVLYWFVTSPTVDAIVEYRDDPTNQSANTCVPILVDKKVGTSEAVLKFDPSNIITGINIIDNLLFWTDDVNEPKKINIDTFKLNPNNGLGSHSQMFVNENTVGDVAEDHITVIRKRPQKAPTVTFSEAAIQPTFVFPSGGFDSLDAGDDMNFFQKIVGSEVHGAFLQTTNVTSPYEIGDRLFLSEVGAVGNLPQNYQTKVEIISSPTTVNGGYICSFEILEIIVSSVTNVFADGIARSFNVVKEVDEKTIFEKEFIRFATRYKYADGEYSAFSPFTQPVFLSGVFGFHPTKDPYNLGMESKIISVRLQDLIPTDVPNDVVQLDILFKKERSTTIYSIDSIKPNDPAPNYWNKNDYNQRTILTTGYGSGGFGNTTQYHDNNFIYDYTGEYEITTENIYAALPENQMLRPWDNVPRKALAQEITANRIVYANYLQNYDFKDGSGNLVKPQINVDKEERSFYNSSISFNDGLGKKSIKSLRTYYLGVVYGDKYGRETPVFTSKDASIHIPYDLDNGPLFDNAAAKSLRLTARLIGEQPAWADYYKYFIKQTTGEYYNLTLDRVYKNVDDGSFWLSFPSSDRNKIQEGDYFTIKKQVDLEQIVPEENKIKIIDIKNEAPDSIKFEHVLLGTVGKPTFGQVNWQWPTRVFPNQNFQPAFGVKALQVDLFQWLDAKGPDLMEALTPSDKISVQFQILQGGKIIRSKKYIVAAYSFNADATSPPYTGPPLGGSTSNSIGEYSIVLKDAILRKDSWVEQSIGVMNSDAQLSMSIFRIVEKNTVEFSGRFFVKTISDAITQRYVVGSISDLYNYEALAQMDMFNLADAPGSTYANGGVEGIYNTQTTWTQTSPYDLTDTELEWDALTEFDAGVGNGSQRGWFLDSTGYVALAGANHVDAYNSGVMTLSNPFLGSVGDPGVVNGFEGVIDYNVGDLYKTVTSYTQSGQQDIHPHPQAGRVILNQVRHLESSLITIDDGIPSIGNWNGTSWCYKPLNYPDPSNTPFFLHWSYACPGEDLHNNDFSALEDAIDTWGTYTQTVDFLNDFFEFGLQKIKATQIMVSAAPGFTLPAMGSIGSWQFETPTVTSYDGLSVSDKEITDSCFDPGYNSLAEQAIIENIEKVGARFMIDGDNNNEYNILSVKKRNVYNHTPWNIIAPHDATSAAVQTISALNENVSVTKKLQNFFNYLGTNGSFTIDPDPLTGYRASTEWDELKTAVYNFGKANNRRRVYILELDKDPRISWALPDSILTTDPDESQVIRFVDDFIDTDENNLPTSPAIFETEAKEDVDLNIYYEASGALPIKLDSDIESLKGHLLGPVGNKVTCGADFTPLGTQNTQFPGNDFHTRVVGWEGDIVEVNNPGLRFWGAPPTLVDQNIEFENKTITFWREDLSYTTAKIESVEEITGNYITKLKIKPQVYNKTVGLPYYNCFSFGNGVESNRIRDDFNESYILNGVKASTVLEEPYEEERRKYGLIYSGLYNSTSGVNNLNQFIQAEKITKDLMPSYGSIQKLYARDKDLITLCEDKIIRVYVDKDILYNADGNSQLLATNRVLGTAEPFRGNFGISRNPESFAAESFRAYFTDKQRGAVIRLSMDGLTPISDAGMHDFFRDNLRDGGRLHGSYDAHKGDYNLSIYFEDATNQVCNPGFDEGITTGVDLMPSTLGGFIENYSFTSSGGTLASVVTQLSRNWATGGGQQFYTTYIDLDDSTGVEVGMSVITITGNDSTGPLAGMSPYGLPIPMNTITVDSISVGGGAGGSDRLNLSSTLVGINGSSTLGALSGFDITFEKIDTVVTDDWTLNNSVTNNNGTLIFSDGGVAVQYSNPTGVESGKLYRVTSVLSSPDGIGPQNAMVIVNGMLVNAVDLNQAPPTLAQAGTVIEDVYFPSTTSDIVIDVSGGTINLHSITIQEITPYGGTVECWDLNGGADQDKIYTSLASFVGGSIVFDEALENTYLRQPLINTNQILDFTDGVKCNVKFNITNYTGSGELTFRLYNDEGEGFEHAVSGNGSYSFSGIIGSENISNVSPNAGKFGFYVSSIDTFSGEIDNVSLVIDGEGAGKTISFNEKSKGWTSFKSFVPEFGISNVNQYYTMNLGQLWKHHINETRNTFYGVGPDQDANAESSITPILNMQPAVVKNFNTLNYEGSQSKVDQFLTYEVTSDQPFPIGSNLMIPSGSLAAAFNPQASNSNANFTTNTNNISIIDLHGEGGVSDIVQIGMPNLDITKTYRLSFNFSVTGQSGQSHVYFGGVSFLALSSGLSGGLFSEDFTPANTTEYLLILHPHLLNGFTQDVDVTLANILLQELDFTTDENDGEYYNLQAEKGWYVYDIHTDKQEGTLNEFIEKEGKWFNYIKGKPGQVDTAAFNLQGLGMVETIDIL